MSYTDALARISQIETQIAALSGGPTAPAAATAATAPTGATGVTASGPGSFADALGQAQGVPAGAQGKLTSGQAEFATRLAAQTGLDPGVISAWLLAEESGSAATSRESAHNNDWLNIGYTDSGTFGSADSIWSSPDSA